MYAIFAFICVWMAGCGGCNPEPEPENMSPTKGPADGGTTVRITGDKFDIKNGVTVTFGGKQGVNPVVTSKTEVSVVTPAGTVGESVDVEITNNGKPDMAVKLEQQFTYTDATSPTVVSTDPVDATEFSEYEDSLNVRDSVSVTFSEDIDPGSVMIEVAVAKTEDSLSEPAEAMLAGAVSGSGDTFTFTTAEDGMPMRAGRIYAVTVSGAKDMAGNPLAEAHSFSFTITSPELVDKYYFVTEEDIQEVNGEAALKNIASRPEVYDNAELWKRIVEANQYQEDYIFDRTKLMAGQRLFIARGPAWGDK